MLRTLWLLDLAHHQHLEYFSMRSGGALVVVHYPMNSGVVQCLHQAVLKGAP